MEEEVRVVKSVICDSVSGKSKLTYELGVLDGKDLQFRITKNSGGGMFCKDWVSMAAVIEVLSDPSVKEGIAATAFKSIFAGRSVNTQSFLLAALKGEGVVQAHSVKPRGYEVVDADAFRARMQALIDVPFELTVDGSVCPVNTSVEAVSKRKPGKVKLLSE